MIYVFRIQEFVYSKYVIVYLSDNHILISNSAWL